LTLQRRGLLAAAGGAALFGGCASTPQGPISRAPRLEPLVPSDGPPAVPREFRGAWVATVANIDWPRAPGLAAEEQQAQLRAIVQRAKALGLNALVLQVRPAGDAIYASALEPFSEFVSGTQGVAPPYDPLALWIDEAHAAGLELHAWFNPFRARHPSAQSPLAPQHIALRQPGWVRAYGEALWLDPGEPGAVEHSLAVIEDVTRRYDVDGVHIDDYFYPYPVKGPDGNDQPFPDDASFAASGTALERDDWRRDNVDRFVRELYRRVHAVKPAVKVGISPFGLPRQERRPAGIEGFDARAKLYADAERWIEQGWLDYLAPQLYWPMAQRAQAFDVLLAHWDAANTRRRHLWPGLFASRVALPPNPWPADEIDRQLAHLRANPQLCGGHIHFSMVALMDDRGGMASRWLADLPVPALVPASPWLDARMPAPPRVASGTSGPVVRAGDDAARWLLVWQRRGGTWRMSLQPDGAMVLARDVDALVASSISRAGVESERVAWKVLRHD